MTACCEADVLVFGHPNADCPHTSMPPLDVAARAEHIAWLDQLAVWRAPDMAAKADRTGGSVRLHFRRLARSRT